VSQKNVPPLQLAIFFDTRCMLSSQVHDWRCRNANSNFQFYHILYCNHRSETGVFELYLNHILPPRSQPVCAIM